MRTLKFKPASFSVIMFSNSEKSSSRLHLFIPIVVVQFAMHFALVD